MNGGEARNALTFQLGICSHDIFVNCNWVVTRWQYTFTHKQYIEQYKTNNTWNNTTILEECGPCPVLASITLAFSLQPRKKHGKTSVRVAASKNTKKLYKFPIQNFCICTFWKCLQSFYFLRTALFWAIRQLAMVIPYRRFGTTSLPSSRVKNPRNILKIRKFYIIPTVFCDSYGSKSK